MSDHPCQYCGRSYYPDGHRDCEERPTLQDRFAMAALTYLASSFNSATRAEHAYDQADAMIAERKRRKEET